MDVNMNKLASPCSRVCLVQHRVNCLPCYSWALLRQSRISVCVLGGGGSSFLLSSLCWFRTRYVRCLMAISWIAFIEFLIDGGGMCRLSSSVCILCGCCNDSKRVDFLILSYDGVNEGDIFVVVCWMACSMILSCVKVNSTIWIVRSFVGKSNLVCSKVATFMNTIFGWSLARHVQFALLHVHLSIRSRMVLSRGLSFWVVALMSVKCFLWMHDLSNLAIWWMAALCLVILIAFESFMIKYG